MLWSVVVLSLIVARATAQEPASREGAEVLEDSLSHEPNEAENYSLSALVPRNRDLDGVAASAITAIAAQDYATASDRLAELLNAEGDGLVLFQGSLLQPKLLARALISRLPESGLQAFQRNFSQVAEEAFLRAIESQDVHLLQEFVVQFPGTAASQRARAMWAALERDRGNLLRSGLILNEKFGDSGQAAVEQSRPERLLESGALALSRWSAAFDLSPGAIETIEQGHRDLRENGLTPFSPWDAVFTDKLVLTVSPIRVEARLRTNGELVWSRPLSQYGARILSELTSAQDSLRAWAISQSALFRIFGESLYSSLEHDGQSIFLVEATRDGAKWAVGPKDVAEPANQITCLDVETGNVVWVNDKLHDSRAYVCSPPHVVGDELFVIAEYRETTQLNLLALDPGTGQVLRELPLAKPAKPIEDKEEVSRRRRRQGVACVMQTIGGKTYCPTSAGALIAVDHLHWKVDWVHRYPRHDVAISGTGLLRPEVGLTGYQWWLGWQEPQVEILGDKLAFVSPESDVLTLLDRTTGEVLWTVDRYDGLSIVTVDQQSGVVVLGAGSIRSHRFEDGRVRWETPLNFPCGTGVLTKTSYQFPDGPFGWTSVDLLTGMADESPLNISSREVPVTVVDITTPRNFYTDRGELFELSFRGIRQLETQPQAARPDDAVAGSKLSEPERILASVNDDDIVSVIQQWLPHVDSPEARQAMLVLYQRLWKDVLTSAALSSFSSKELNPAHVVHDQEVLNCWLRIAIEELLERREWSLLTDLLTEQMTRSRLKGFVTDRDRKVRLDLWVMVTLDQAAAGMNAADREQLGDVLEKVWESRQLDAPDEQLFLESLFARTSWSFLQAVDESLSQSSLKDVLAKRIEAATKQGLESVFWSPEEAGNSIRSWPASRPSVRQLPKVSGSVYFSRIPIENIDGSPYCGLNVEIENPGQRAIRFSGQHWKRPWHAYLPATNRVLRHEDELIRGWAVGGLLILQVGSEVYGMSPLGAAGERGGRQLWPPRGKSIDTLGNRSNQMLSFQVQTWPERVGFNPEPASRLNEFGYYATAVGPVRASYFCIQQKGMLVAYETTTGDEMWRRYDLPRQAHCFGDERHVVVMGGLDGRLRVLSARDGRVLESRRSSLEINSVIFSSGLHVLVETGDSYLISEQVEKQPLSLQWLNLQTERSVWTRQWPSGSLPFQIDGKWTGILTASGTIEVIETNTGTTIASHALDATGVSLSVAAVRKIVSHVSADNFLLLFSAGDEDQQILNASQRGGGFRQENVRGPVLCLSRDAGQLLWKTNLDSDVFPVDQPVDLPVFVTAGRRFTDEVMDDRSPGSRIRLFSRHTGEQLYEAESLSPVIMYSVSGDVETGVVTLVTRNVSVEVDFNEDKAN